MIGKIFGGIRMTWKRLILFAVVSGIITGLIALLTPGNRNVKNLEYTGLLTTLSYNQNR